jgi:hypothetical protein
MSKLLLFVGVALVSFQAHATTVAAEFGRCTNNPKTICANFYGETISGQMIPIKASRKIMKQLLSWTDDGRFTMASNVEVEKNGDEIEVVSLVAKDQDAPIPR